jgi:hypothetical protein
MFSVWPQRRHSHLRGEGGVPVVIIRIWHFGQCARESLLSGSAILSAPQPPV